MRICASKLTKNVAMPQIDERAMEAVRLPCRTWLLFQDWHMWLLLRRRSLVCAHEVWRGGEDKTIERAENQMACAKSCTCEAKDLGDCFYLCLFFSYHKVMNDPCKKKKNLETWGEAQNIPQNLTTQKWVLLSFWHISFQFFSMHLCM